MPSSAKNSHVDSARHLLVIKVPHHRTMGRTRFGHPTPSLPPEPVDGHGPDGDAQPSQLQRPLSLELVRRLWDRRSDSWEHHGSAGLERVVDAVVEASAPRTGMVVADLGCGGGQLTIPLARRGAKVTGVDISPRMVDLLREKASRRGLEIDGVVSPIEGVTFPPGSLDLVVSNYAMHHVRDERKAAVVRAAAVWLRPGGRLVVGDMMFGRGSSSRDRQIIAAKAKVMLGRGWAGWWRLGKNVLRFALRIRERPISMEAWTSLFEAAGLVDVTAQPVVAEAAIVSGTKPS